MRASAVASSSSGSRPSSGKNAAPALKRKKCTPQTRAPASATMRSRSRMRSATATGSASASRNTIALAARLFQDVRGFLQDEVADGVAELVVDQLESVHIGRQDGHAAAAPGGILQPRVEPLEQGARVGQPRKVVSGRGLFGLDE